MLGRGAGIDCGRGFSGGWLRGQGSEKSSSHQLAVPEGAAARYPATMGIPRFHLAFPVRGLAEARAFSGGLDPSGDALEFKAFADESMVFAT